MQATKQQPEAEISRAQLRHSLHRMPKAERDAVIALIPDAPKLGDRDRRLAADLFENDLEAAEVHKKYDIPTEHGAKTAIGSILDNLVKQPAARAAAAKHLQWEASVPPMRWTEVRDGMKKVEPDQARAIIEAVPSHTWKVRDVILEHRKINLEYLEQDWSVREFVEVYNQRHPDADLKQRRADQTIRKMMERISGEAKLRQRLQTLTGAGNAEAAEVGLMEVKAPKPPAPKPPAPKPPAEDIVRPEQEPPAPEPPAPEPKAPEPKAPEPKAPEPKAPEPKAPEPKAPEPKAPEPKAPEPKAPEPEPKAPEPKAPEPKAPEPKAPEPKAPEPKPPEPKAPEPKPPEPKAPAPKPPALEKPPAEKKDPKIIEVGNIDSFEDLLAAAENYGRAYGENPKQILKSAGLALGKDTKEHLRRLPKGQHAAEYMVEFEKGINKVGHMIPKAVAFIRTQPPETIAKVQDYLELSLVDASEGPLSLQDIPQLSFNTALADRMARDKIGGERAGQIMSAYHEFHDDFTGSETISGMFHRTLREYRLIESSIKPPQQ